ncbi:hypothetical protein LJK88_40960 [Paenibacillus sp. P26]|nr:hypothetical protein LJK88_40960 [Paenibacillus sp. P26]UUZ92814.1 hypothetical protein LJK87_47360 [Paenibacillus sp. P25]
MKKRRHPTVEKLDRYKALSSAEKVVYDAIADGKARPDDITAISEVCKLSELQTAVALQLLEHKNLIPGVNVES